MGERRRIGRRRLLTAAAIVLVLAVAFALSPLASDGFNGFTREQFPVVNAFWPVQPVGWAFSIWGVIYLWLIAGCVVGVWRARHAPDWAAMRPALCCWRSIRSGSVGSPRCSR